MAKTRVAISIAEPVLRRIDRLVKQNVFSNRSSVFEQAVKEKLARIDKNRLARECGKLNKREEQALADEGLSSDIRRWPEY